VGLTLWHAREEGGVFPLCPIPSLHFTRFTPEGEYQSQIDPDRRMTCWILPALLAAEDPAIKALAPEKLANPGL